jgi:hypothetical protein
MASLLKRLLTVSRTRMAAGNGREANLRRVTFIIPPRSKLLGSVLWSKLSKGAQSVFRESEGMAVDDRISAADFHINSLKKMLKRF